MIFDIMIFDIMIFDNNKVFAVLFVFFFDLVLSCEVKLIISDDDIFLYLLYHSKLIVIHHCSSSLSFEQLSAFI